MFWIFIAIVWVIAVGVGALAHLPQLSRSRSHRRQALCLSRPRACWTVGGASVVFVLATVFFSFAQVNTGHVGVVRTFGRISGQISPGISLIAPWQTYDSVNVQVQKQTFENLTAFSAETQNVNITTTINYSVAPKDARDLIARVGTDWFDRLVPNNLNQAFKDEAVKFTAVDIAPNRETIRTAVLKALRTRLSPYSIRVNDLNIDNIAFSRQFEQAIEAKQEATQAALRAKAQVQQAQFEAQSRVAKAKGEADANVTVAQGQAEANRKLNASLSANVLQYIAIQKLSPLLRIAVLPAGTQLADRPDEAAPGRHRDDRQVARSQAASRKLPRRPAEQLCELGGRHGAREQEALREVAAELAQRGQLRLGLDALGHRDEAEGVRQADDVRRDRGIARIVLGALHERAVDLDHVDREAPQLPERREAGAEVVDGDADAVGVQRLQLGARALAGRAALHDRRLGHLEPEPSRRAGPSRPARCARACRCRPPRAACPRG